MIDAVIYARYSSDNQTERSIEGQLQDNREFADRNDYNIVGVYVDRAISGRKEDRPDFQRMIQDAKLGKFKVVIVWKLDRFARDRYIFAVYKKELKKYGVNVVSAMENINTSTPEGAMFEGILESWAEYYSSNLSQNVKRGMNLLKKQAKYFGGPIPVGLKVDENKKYVVDPLTSKYVKESFHMFINGAKIKEIVDYLNRNSVLNCIGKANTYNTVNKMLKNKKYIGVYESGDYYFDDAIPPIIDKETFYQAQEILEKKLHKRKNADFLLSGKCTCGLCGSSITGTSGTSKQKKTYYYYKCSQINDHDCSFTNIPRQQLEDEIAKITKRDIFHEEVIQYIAKELYRQYQDYKNDDNLLKTLEREISKINKKLENLVIALENGIFNETIQEKMISLENERKTLEKQLFIEKQKKPDISQDFIEFSLFSMFEDNDTKSILESFVKDLVIYKDKIEITYSCCDEPLSVRLTSEWQTTKKFTRTPFGFDILFHNNFTFTIQIPFHQ